METRLNFSVGYDGSNRGYLKSATDKKEYALSDSQLDALVLQVAINYLIGDNLQGDDVDKFDDDVQWILKTEMDFVCDNLVDVYVDYRGKKYTYYNVIDVSDNQGKVQSYFNLYSIIVDVVLNHGKDANNFTDIM